MSLIKKSVFITGGSSGMGLALARKYVDMGARVGVCGRSKQKFEKYAHDMQSRVHFYELNVTDLASQKNAIHDFAKDGLDIVIANAGIGYAKKSSRPKWDVGRDIIQTNVIGMMNTFDCASEIMLERGGGQLVAVASVAGYIGVPGVSAYSASKAAVKIMCESLAIDLRPKGIDVTCLCPGYIDTPLTSTNKHTMPFLLDADTAAIYMIRAINKKRVMYAFPWPMAWLTKLLSCLPRWAYVRLMQMRKLNFLAKEK